MGDRSINSKLDGIEKNTPARGRTRLKQFSKKSFDSMI